MAAAVDPGVFRDTRVLSGPSGPSDEFRWEAQVLSGLRQAPDVTPPPERTLAKAHGKTGLSLLAQLLSPQMRRMGVCTPEGPTTSNSSGAPSRARMSPAGSEDLSAPDSPSFEASSLSSMSDMSPGSPATRRSTSALQRANTPAGGDTSADSGEWASPPPKRVVKRARGGRSPPSMSQAAKGKAAASTLPTTTAGVTLRGTKTNVKASGGSRTRKFTSTFHGVSWHKRSQRWAVQIRNNGKRIHVGYFNDEVQAALAYDRVARDLRGERARVNFEPSGTRTQSSGSRHSSQAIIPGVATKKTAAIAAAAVAKAAANGATLAKHRKGSRASTSSSRTSGSDSDNTSNRSRPRGRAASAGSETSTGFSSSASSTSTGSTRATGTRPGAAGGTPVKAPPRRRWKRSAIRKTVLAPSGGAAGKAEGSGSGSGTGAGGHTMFSRKRSEGVDGSLALKLAAQGAAGKGGVRRTAAPLTAWRLEPHPQASQAHAQQVRAADWYFNQQRVTAVKRDRRGRVGILR